jgi:hypothetical protein
MLRIFLYGSTQNEMEKDYLLTIKQGSGGGVYAPRKYVEFDLSAIYSLNVIKQKFI